MKLILSFIFLMLTARGMAQLNSPAHTYTFSGYITDEMQVPLPNTTLRLYNNIDSSLLITTVSTNKGYFEFKLNSSKSYYIIITYTGFKTLKISFDQIRSAPGGQMGYIRLKEDINQLKQAVIKGKQPIVQQRTDRTVIVVNEQVKKLAENALDMIRLAPGITISDNEDVIQMSGKDAVEVMINDRIVKLTSRDLVKLLKSLPVDAVNQLEVMTNPSAKYEVSGNKGLLNIKTRQNTIKGITGNVDLAHSQASHGMGDLATNINYGAGKFAVSGYFAYHYGNYPSLTTTDRHLHTALLHQNTNSADQWRDPAMRMTAEYYINSKQVIGAIVSDEHSYNTSNYQTSSYLDQVLLRDTSYQTNGYGPNTSHWNTYNLNYRFVDAGDTEFSFDLDRSLYNKDDQNNIANIIAGINTLNGNTYKTLTDITINTFKGDYTHIWKNKLKAEAGFKISGVSTNNNFLATNIVNGNAKMDNSQTNRFLYKEYVNAAYFNLSKNYGKWGLQFGLRAEYSKIKGISTDIMGNSSTKPDSSYLNLLPAAYVTYSPSAAHGFRLSFNQRVKRPNYSALQPFTYQTDAFNYETGNPALRVQKNSNAELSYTYDNRIVISSAYTHTTDFFNPVMYMVGNITYRTTLNSGTMNGWNFNLNYPAKVTKWWNMLNKLNGFYNHFNRQLYQGILNEGKWSYSLSTSQRITLPSKYSIIVSGRYNSPLQNLIYYQQSNANVSVSIGRKILKEQGSFRIGISDIFRMQRTNTLVNFGDLRYIQNETWESRRLSLSFAWRFGNKKIKETQERSTGSRDEKNRSGS
jgi:iron complex outermembrane receptor protein